MIRASDVISFLESNASWVNFQQTRDVVLYGNENIEVRGIGICWVATIQVIEQAIEQGINFIVSHENAFYENGTSTPTPIRESIKRKELLLKQHKICVYRCHDVWDCIPYYGVSDTYARLLGYAFKPRKIQSFIQFAHIDETSLEDVAIHIKNKLAPFNQSSIQYFGNKESVIKSIAIGTGAATNIFQMNQSDPDCYVVSDDGHNNWVETQWILDNNKSMIVVNHAACEIPGMKSMVSYLLNQFVDENIQYLDEGYNIHTAL